MVAEAIPMTSASTSRETNPHPASRGPSLDRAEALHASGTGELSAGARRVLQALGPPGTGAATLDAEDANRRVVVLPHEDIEQPVRAYLTSAWRPILPPLRAIIITAARRGLIPIVGLRLSVSRDLEENTNRVVCTVAVRGSPEQALGYWDYLGERVQRWVESAPPEIAELVNTELAVYVDWR